MKNLTNENLISPEVLFDFNSIIKKLNLTNLEFSYEPFVYGFKLNPEETYLVIDYESSGNYLIKILDNRNSAQVIKGFKLGKNITNSKMIAPNPFVSIGNNNSIKYFKLIKSNNNEKDNLITEQSFINKTNNTLPYTPKIYHKSNHNENIIKIMDKLIEMHFKNNTYNNSNNHLNNHLNNQSVNSVKSINLNEIIPRKSSGNINLNEINLINNNQPSKNKNLINYQEIIKIQKWKNELYSMLF